MAPPQLRQIIQLALSGRLEHPDPQVINNGRDVENTGVDLCCIRVVGFGLTPDFFFDLGVQRLLIDLVVPPINLGAALAVVRTKALAVGDTARRRVHVVRRLSILNVAEMQSQSIREFFAVFRRNSSGKRRIALYPSFVICRNEAQRGANDKNP